MWKSSNRWIFAIAIIVFNVASMRTQNSRVETQNPRIGGAINVFSRYGYLSISMKVVPRNDTDSWIFREPTLDIFYKDPPAPLSIQQPQQQAKKGASIFHGDFHMEFCDNMRQLLQAYFRDFTFEKIERPWRAFTASWSKAAIAKHLGINASFVTSNHCYVLVRVARYRDNQKLAGTPEELVVDEVVSREANNVTVGDTISVVRFIRNFGSHYIASFVTGNSLYQVFVYTPQVYYRIKERLKSQGVADLSSLELSNYFSPWYAANMGTIQSASGNRSVEKWAVERLRVKYYIFTYANLLKLHGDGALLRQLDAMLGNEALLSLQLRTLAPIFKDPERREWFLQVVDNYFKLWEINM